MTYLQNRDRLTDLGNKLAVTRRERWGEWINWELGLTYIIHTTIFKIDNQ